MRVVEHAYVVLDVFTETPLEGNPVAIFLAAGGLDGETMQAAARELHLSETVFVVGRDEPDADARIRIFTPTLELPFAGHPVLGTAVALAAADSDVTRLATGVGVVPVRIDRDADGVARGGTMEQPLPTWARFAAADELHAALGLTGSALPVEVYDNSSRHVSVLLDDPDVLDRLRPDLRALAGLGPMSISCVVRTTPGGVRSRVFCPGLGVDEDPATGAAAGPLVVHLARHGVHPFAQELTIAQGAGLGRPSRLRARVEGTRDELRRVTVAGSAVLVGRGTYRLA